jgi:hypothetical protein
MSETKQANEKRRAEFDEYEARMEMLTEMVVHGASRHDVIGYCVQRWGLSRRTAEVCLQTIRRRMACDAAAEDRLFYLKLSQLQRDRLVQVAMRYSQLEQFNASVLNALAAMITAVRGLLDSRDRTAVEICELIEVKLSAANNLVKTASNVQAGSASGEGAPAANEDSPPSADERCETAQEVPQPYTNGHAKPLGERLGERLGEPLGDPLDEPLANGNGKTSAEGLAKTPIPAGPDRTPGTVNRVLGEYFADRTNASRPTPPSRNGGRAVRKPRDIRHKINGDERLAPDAATHDAAAAGCADCATVA